MCDPVTALAVTAVVVAGTGAYVSARSARNAASTQEKIAQNNAVIAERQAEDSEKRGREAEFNYRKRIKALKGKQRAAFSASGVVVDEGSALDILADTAEQGEFDALVIRNNAEREAYGFRAQSANFQNQSSLHGLQKKSISPLFEAGSTAITTGASFAGSFGGGGGSGSGASASSGGGASNG